MTRAINMVAGCSCIRKKARALIKASGRPVGALHWQFPDNVKERCVPNSTFRKGLNYLRNFLIN